MDKSLKLLARSWRLALCATLIAAAGGVTITGKVLFGDPSGGERPAVVDILTVYANNPAYLMMKARGLSESDPRGGALFGKAQKAANKALATVAASHGFDVITVPGGVAGAEDPVPDVTAQVIELLPLHFVDGKVLSGTTVGRSAAQLDTPTVLEAIPAWREFSRLDPSDANYHLLRKRYTDEYNRVVREAAAIGGYELVVEQGGIASRLGPVPEITSTAVALVQS